MPGVAALTLSQYAYMLSSIECEQRLADFHTAVEELKKAKVEANVALVPHPAGNRRERRAYEAQQRKASRR